MTVTAAQFCDMGVFVFRCESTDRHRDGTDAAGPQWAGQGVSADLSPQVPADGGTGGTEHTGHCERQEEPRARLLPVLAQEQDPTH